MIRYSYTIWKITTVSLVNIHHHTAIKSLFFLVMRTFKTYSLSNFQICSIINCTVLLTIIAMLYIISPGLIYTWRFLSFDSSPAISIGSRFAVGFFQDGSLRTMSPSFCFILLYFLYVMIFIFFSLYLVYSVPSMFYCTAWWYFILFFQSFWLRYIVNLKCCVGIPVMA